MENHRFVNRALVASKFVFIYLLLACIIVLPVVASAQEDIEFSFHDGTPWGGAWLYPALNNAAGFFMFPIDWEPWMDTIEFTHLRFFHTEELGRPFKILMILRDYEDEEYEIVNDTSVRETTCTDCWEEVDLYFQATSFLGSFNRCYGMFVHIPPDETQPIEPFIIWSDGYVDHPLSSARYTSVSSNLGHPSYNSDSGYGEYLIEVDALIWGITPTGETTFSEIKLMYGNH